MRDFLRREGLFTVVVIAIVAIALWLIPKIEFSWTTRLILLGLPVLFFGILIAIVAGIATLARDKKAGVSLEKIIRNVAPNHIWVLRNAWYSNPATLEGYTEKREGWRFFIPEVWHKDVATVSLVPLQRDPDSIEVNTKDNMLVSVDYRIKSWVAMDEVTESALLENGRVYPAIDMAAARYAVRVVTDETRERLEQQYTTVVINQETNEYKAGKLTAFGRDELIDLSRKVTEIVNRELVFFGLKAEMTIQNIAPPEAVQVAAQERTASRIRKEEAKAKRDAYKTIIDGTGANPNWVLLSENAANLLESLRGLLGKK